MIKLSTLKVSTLNIFIIIIVAFLSIGATVNIVEFTNDVIINPKTFSDLDKSRPILRPFDDVFFYLKPEIMRNDERAYQRVQRNQLIFNTIYTIAYVSFVIMLVLQLRKLILSLKADSFYRQTNLKLVSNIAHILLGLVIVEFILFQSIQFFIPLSLVEARFNYVPLNKGILVSLLVSVDYSMLLAAFAFYIISMVFSEGYKLKEQTDLTI